MKRPGNITVGQPLPHVQVESPDSEPSPSPSGGHSPPPDGAKTAVSEKSTLSTRVCGWLLAMCTVATVMVIVNKHVFKQLPCPCIVTGVQNAATVLINVAATKAGFLEMKPWKLSEIKQFLVQGLFFAATLGLSNFGLPRVATSTLIVPKSLTTVFCMWAETWLGLATFGITAHLALLTSFGGSVLYAIEDVNYEPAGYLAFMAVSIVNCLVSVIERKISVSVEQTPAGISCYKNLVSVPFFVVFALLTNELNTIQTVQLSSNVLSMALLSTFLGFGLSLCYANLYKITSATTVLATANVNKLATSIFGNKIFVERTTPSAGLGLMLSLGGVMVYALDKARVNVMAPHVIISMAFVLCLGVYILTIL